MADTIDLSCFNPPGGTYYILSIMNYADWKTFQNNLILISVKVTPWQIPVLECEALGLHIF